MSKIHLFILLAFLFLTSNFAFGQNDVPKEILFVGNSYTYFWNLPQTVNFMAESQDLQYTVRQSTAGGASLANHWKGEKGLNSVDKIKNGNYNIVIIQDLSTQAIDNPDTLLYYGNKFGDLINSKGAKPYVYMTWSRQWDPYMQEEISKKYELLAKEINAVIVPVGPAWQRALELRPDLPLYFDDGSHPSTLGTYLSACVFYAVLTGNSPIGLEPRIFSEDKNGEKIYINFQSPENALFCQKVADEIVLKAIK